MPFNSLATRGVASDINTIHVPVNENSKLRLKPFRRAHRGALSSSVPPIAIV